MARLRDAAGFQQEKIEDLKKETFDQLSRRPVREKLPVPPDLQGLKIFVCRKSGENGGVEVTVRVERRSLLIVALVSEDGFEMLPDGKIIPFDDGKYDDQD
jgi:hypothetical protein